jgi:spermidine synthase
MRATLIAEQNIVENAQAENHVAMSHPLIMPLVFVCGLSSIGTELAASRLVAPYFGTSTFIWANLIGLTLAFLAVGYYVGGILADRRPKPVWMFGIALLAGGFTGLIPFLARPILRSSLGAIDNVDAGAFYGSLLGVMILLAVPMTAFGCITPFAIRLRSTGVASSGNNAGHVWALSTVGSIVGSFLPVLVLIPTIGTRRTFFVMSLLVLSIATVGLFVSRPSIGSAWVVGLALILALAGSHTVLGSGQIKPPYRGTLVEEVESSYHYIQVLREDGAYLLALDEGHAIHSIYDPDDPLTGGPWDYFALSPYFVTGQEPSIDTALIIGLAGGTAARTILEIEPEATIDGVEIDPEIVRVGRKYFALADPRIEAHVDDGRYFLSNSDQAWDLIAIDAYRQPYVPFHLTTKEFFAEVSDHLTETGLVALNAGRTSNDYRLVKVLASTMLSVFPHVFLVDADRYDNTLIFGTHAPASVETLKSYAVELDPASISGSIVSTAVALGNPRPAVATNEPYSDDHAPVEWLIDRMIVDVARGRDR